MSKVLVLAPHADDEVLGAGGTIAKHVAASDRVTVAVLTGHGKVGQHPIYSEARFNQVRAEARKANELLGSELVFCDIPAALVADQPTWKVNEVVAEVIEEIGPEVLYVPFVYDLHLDHRLLTYAACVAWRPISNTARSIRRIYMYETLSETHWNIRVQEGGFLPNVFVDISGDSLEKKLKALACYETQLRHFPHCRSIEAVNALARFRGSLVGIQAAEAFVLVREVL